MNTLHNACRTGSFTSSQVGALMSAGRQQDGFGTAAITYIAETNYERLLGQPLAAGDMPRAVSWGACLEPRVHQLLPTSYTYSPHATDVHPHIPWLAGSKDGTNEAGPRAVTDIKCPLTHKSFVQLVLPLYLGYTGIEAMQAVRHGFTYQGFTYPRHREGEQYYWQLVSNALINGVDMAELIVYMPYKSELPEVRKLADSNPDMYWMSFAAAGEIPCLPDGGFFRNLNILRFAIPPADLELLEATVRKAGQYLLDPAATPAMHTRGQHGAAG